MRLLTWLLAVVFVLWLGAGVSLFLLNSNPPVGVETKKALTTAELLSATLAPGIDSRIVQAVAAAWDKDGVAVALRIAREQTASTNIKDRDVGHELAHGLGQVLFGKTGSVPESLKACTNENNGGCYHGAVWAYVMKLPPSKDLDPMQVCPLGGDSLAEQECWHGLGHALSDWVPDKDLEATLGYCQTKTPLQISGLCARGVLMARLVEKKEVAPEVVCAKLVGFRRACHASMPLIIDASFPRDWPRVGGACDSTPVEHRSVCWQAFGALLVQRETTAIVAMRTCKDVATQKPLGEECVVGVLTGSTFSDAQLAAECVGLQSSSSRSFCYGLVGRQLRTQSDLSAVQRQARCDALPDADAKTNCTQALR